MNNLSWKELTVSQKTGQIIMPRLDFRGSDPLPQARELVQRFHVGGFIVFGGEREQVKEATHELQSISLIPLFFACDAERGLGQTVSGATRFPFTMSLGAIGDEELVYKQARFIAGEMKGCGLNLIFAPVADVNTKPENPIINIRSYGDDPFLVSRLVAAFVKGCQDRGVLACAKHFPGHGGVEIDSHITLPYSDQNLEDFWRCDLIPFKEAIQSWVASVMIAHLAVPQVDPAGVPAPISEKIIRELLIRDLGFKGLVITDSFYMGAITELGSEEDVACLSLLAGCDIVLDPREPVRLIERLNEMFEDGQILELLLDNSVEKIIEAKNKWLGAQQSEKLLNEESGENMLSEIAGRSVCRLRDGKLNSKKATVYVLDVTQAGEEVAQPFLQSLAEAEMECKEKYLTQDTEMFLPEGGSKDEAIMCLVYTSVAAWKGHTNLPGSFKKFLDRVADLDCKKVLISFGSPYIIRGFEKFDTILCTFDHLDVCQLAVTDVLLGRLEAQGKLPVKL
ncbi:MAG TPA: glycoside hydrolase family 3 protein [Thermodesulfobacteriota bacterium]|nr:glycoside hydrolase family 3 protein [Thermodesulfobacteriota bacterium]